MKYISLKYHKYRLHKIINKKLIDFGSYPSLEVARYMRELFIQNNWEIPFDETTIFKIDETYHVVANLTKYNLKTNIQYLGSTQNYKQAQELSKNPLGERWISKQQKYKIMRKHVPFGYFEDHEVAYAMRDYLVLCEWKLPSHNKPYVIHINDKYYLIRAENNYLTCIDYKENKEELEEEDSTHNIYKTKHGYSISKFINKKRENFLTYPTLEEAQSMREFLRTHNWNKKAFQKEYDKRYPQLPQYIYKVEGKYLVRRYWRGNVKSYGQYTTLKEAENRVKYLEEHNWQTNKNLNIVNYDGTFHIYKSITVGYCTPFREYYYSSEDKEDALETLEKYKTEGFPKPVSITNKYRYIIRNRQVYYIMYRRKKLCYTHKLKYAFVARDICEWLGMKPLSEGVYVWDGVEYLVELNPWGTPVFMIH